MIKAGMSHMLSFLVSLIVGHATLLLFEAYIPPISAFFLRFGQAIAFIFKISYDQKTMAAFIIACGLSFFIGILFHKLLKLGR